MVSPVKTAPVCVLGVVAPTAVFVGFCSVASWVASGALVGAGVEREVVTCVGVAGDASEQPPHTKIRATNTVNTRMGKRVVEPDTISFISLPPVVAVVAPDRHSDRPVPCLL